MSISEHSSYDLGGIRKEILREMPLGSISRCFDVGTANGHFAEAVASHFPACSVLALDIVSAFLDRGRTRLENSPLIKQIHFECADIRSFSHLGSFDLISSFLGFRDILFDTDLGQLLSKCKSLLSLDGTLLICDTFTDMPLTQECIHGLDLNTKLGYKFLSEKEVRASLEDLGFVVFAEKTVSPPPHRISGSRLFHYVHQEYGYYLLQGRVKGEFETWADGILADVDLSLEYNVETPVKALACRLVD